MRFVKRHLLDRRNELLCLVAYVSEHSISFLFMFQIGSCPDNALNTSEREIKMLEMGSCHIT